MFEVNEGISVADAVARAKARQTESAEPTESDAVAQDVSEDEDTQEPLEQDDVESNDDTETRTSDESDDDDSEQDESPDTDSDLFYDIDDEEVSATQIKEWKSGAMKAADYTRKTQELAKKSKEFEQLQSEFAAKQAKLDSAMAEVEAIIAESTPDEETLKDWREYEPEKYIDYKEKKEARDKLLANTKSAKSSDSNYEKEYTAFAKSNTDWFDNGKPTEKAKQDIKVMSDYAEANGFTNDDLTGLKTHQFKMLLDAAKYNNAKKGNAAVAKKVRKAPAITKPRQGVKSSLQQDIKAAQERFNRTGTIADSVALRKLKAKLNN